MTGQLSLKVGPFDLGESVCDYLSLLLSPPTESDRAVNAADNGGRGPADVTGTLEGASPCANS